MDTAGGYHTDTSDMAVVHRAILGALGSAPTYVAHAKDPERVALVANFYDNVIEFLHVHHAGEDEILYPLLEARCAHEKESLELIDAQHRLLDAPMEVVREAIAAWSADPGEATASALVDALGQVDTILTPHLADEEACVVPLASQYLTQQEWGQLPAHSMGSFNRDKPWLAMGLILEQLDAGQREHMIGAMPPPVQELWAQQWSPAFDQLIAEVRA